MDQIGPLTFHGFKLIEPFIAFSYAVLYSMDIESIIYSFDISIKNMTSGNIKAREDC